MIKWRPSVYLYCAVMLLVFPFFGNIAYGQDSEDFSEVFKFDLKHNNEAESFSFADTASHPVDITDFLKIEVDRDVLGTLALSNTPPSPELSKTRDSIEKLKQVIESINALSKIASDIAEKRAAILSKQNAESVDSLEVEYRSTVKEFERNWITTKKLVRDYLFSVMSEADADKKYNDFIHDVSNRELADYLKREISRLSAVCSDLIVKTVNEAPLQLRLRAVLLKKSGSQVPVHLRGYDNGKDGEYRFTDKLSFVQSPEQQQEVDSSLKAATELSNSINSSIAQKRSLQAALDDVFKILLKSGLDIPDVNELRERADLVLKEAGGVESQLSTVKNNAAAIDLKSRIKQLEITLDSFNSYQQVKDLIKLLDNPSNSGDLETLTSIQSKIQTLIPAIKNDFDALKGDELQAKLISLAKSLVLSGDDGQAFKNSVEELARRVGSFSDSIKRFADNVKSMSDDIGRYQKPADLVAGVANSDWKFYNVDLKDAKDTSVDMNTVSSDDGDVLRISAELLQKGPKEEATTIQDTSANLQIGKLGWSAHVSGDLLLIKREQDGKFVTAPGLSYTYSYRPWSEEDGWDKFFTVLNPGIGLSVATLNFDNDATQIGLGLEFTFLKGLLSVGGGYNLQSDQRHRYMLIGLRLTQLLNKFKESN